MKNQRKHFAIGSTTQGNMIKIPDSLDSTIITCFLNSHDTRDKADIFCVVKANCAKDQINLIPKNLYLSSLECLNILSQYFKAGKFDQYFATLKLKSEADFIRHGKSLCYRNFSYY